MRSLRFSPWFLLSFLVFFISSLCDFLLNLSKYWKKSFSSCFSWDWDFLDVKFFWNFFSQVNLSFINYFGFFKDVWKKHVRNTGKNSSNIFCGVQAWVFFLIFLWFFHRHLLCLFSQVNWPLSLAVFSFFQRGFKKTITVEKNMVEHCSKFFQIYFAMHKLWLFFLNFVDFFLSRDGTHII